MKEPWHHTCKWILNTFMQAYLFLFLFLCFCFCAWNLYQKGLFAQGKKSNLYTPVGADGVQAYEACIFVLSLAWIQRFQHLLLMCLRYGIIFICSCPCYAASCEQSLCIYSSKMRSVAVWQDHVMVWFASNFCGICFFATARKVAPCAS